MNQHKKPGFALFEILDKADTYHLLVNISLIVLLPVLSIICEFKIEHSAINWELTGKWFIFWAIGMRLFLSGIRQASSPEFTVTKIFRVRNRETFILNRRLGFASIALGIMGILSVINDEWRMIAAITSGVFFGLSVIQDATGKIVNLVEISVLIFDVLTFCVLGLFLNFTLTG
jgi:hypothetical protein